ncbi:hypothetical protein NL676_009608 [Syzygium grande]|nr:hypothetical protein NL676_009608 [Syzygium grande]
MASPDHMVSVNPKSFLIRASSTPTSLRTTLATPRPLPKPSRNPSPPLPLPPPPTTSSPPFYPCRRRPMPLGVQPGGHGIETQRVFIPGVSRKVPRQKMENLN